MVVGPPNGPGVAAPAPPPPPPPAPAVIVLTPRERTHPEESIAVLMEQIAAIPIPGNPQNVGPLHDEVRLYKKIQAIIDYRLITLQQNINPAQKGGRNARRRNSKTKRRYSR